MKDTELNEKLASAMGWSFDEQETDADEPTAKTLADGVVICWDVDSYKWRDFSYLDPIIFDAIIAHWELDITWLNDFFTNEALVDVSMLHGNIFTRPKNKRYEAAALCVIDAVKRCEK